MSDLFPRVQAPQVETETKKFVLTFGRYAGRALAEIAATDAGLTYLAWLCGDLKKKRQPWQDGTLAMLQAFLADKEMAAALERVKRRQPQRGAGRTHAQRQRSYEYGM